MTRGANSSALGVIEHGRMLFCLTRRALYLEFQSLSLKSNTAADTSLDVPAVKNDSLV